ncbi:hypothetical protein D5018_11360 [Parashewanella curva]|uniref:Uncharacterized protein n=1 Tax=Parashewanella curva TaxID=2338552 RepID=A0A3L8PVV6_9GAMM|nr:hypothetical protein [Parashewanella curva]RLV59545.1 hypothetical protein D5018_11360 [Parashewanella curva]
MNGQAYEALFWNQNKDPSKLENQNPKKNNGQPWYPIGKWHNYTQQELKNAPYYSAQTLYDSHELVNIKSNFYISQQIVKDVLPTQISPWQIYVDWGNVKQQIGDADTPWPEYVFAPYTDMLFLAPRT